MTRPSVTLHELQTCYDLEDVYDMVEVYLVNVHNERAMRKASGKK